MGGGGGVAMQIEGAYIYVVSGNQIFKIEKNDLKIAGKAELPGPRPPQQGGPPPPSEK